MTARHRNVALFVPQQGCPAQCVYCNQPRISGENGRVTAQAVHNAVKTALAQNESYPAALGEIAFFGGSFTAIDAAYRRELLEAAYPYIEKGFFHGVRVSTRPDAIDPAVCAELKRFGVTTVELGAQSMNDAVLAQCKRGHNAAAVERAAALLHENGFRLGLQMMTGLPGSDDADSFHTAECFIALSADIVRIYPTLVLRGTALEQLFRAGEYRPQTIEEATRLCAALLERFHAAQIPVIRLGLHAGEMLENSRVAGPWHPAFREICESEIYFARAVRALREVPKETEITLAVAPRALSQMIGQKQENLHRLRALGYPCRVAAAQGMQEYEVKTKWY